MKNTRNLLIALSLLAFLTIACSTIKNLAGSGSSSNSAGSSVGSDGKILDSAKTGIPECDQLIEKLDAKVNEDSNHSTYVGRAFYEYIKDQVLKPIRDDLANKTPAEKKDIAAKCGDYLYRLEQQEAKDKQNGK